MFKISIMGHFKMKVISLIQLALSILSLSSLVSSFNFDYKNVIYFESTNKNSDFGLTFRLQDSKLPGRNSIIYVGDNINNEVYSCNLVTLQLKNSNCQSGIGDFMRRIPLRFKRNVGRVIARQKSDGAILITNFDLIKRGSIYDNNKNRFNVYGESALFGRSIASGNQATYASLYRAGKYINIQKKRQVKSMLDEPGKNWRRLGIKMCVVGNHSLVFAAPLPPKYDKQAIGENAIPQYFWDLYKNYVVLRNTADNDNGGGAAAGSPTKHQIFGPHMFSGFGNSLKAVDLNGDGLEDLLVGAPNYGTRGKIQVGAVFIYWNRAKTSAGAQPFLPDDKPTRVTLKHPVRYQRFGFSVASLDDVNKDGLNDFAVGALGFADTNQPGMVYIFHGWKPELTADRSKAPASPEPSQALKMPSAGFGYEMDSDGIDIDQNGYPDLAVSSISARRVDVLRTRPILLFVLQKNEFIKSTSVSLNASNHYQLTEKFITIEPKILFRKKDYPMRFDDCSGTPLIKRFPVHYSVYLMKQSKSRWPFSTIEPVKDSNYAETNSRAKDMLIYRSKMTAYNYCVGNRKSESKKLYFSEPLSMVNFIDPIRLKIKWEVLGLEDKVFSKTNMEKMERHYIQDITSQEKDFTINFTPKLTAKDVTLAMMMKSSLQEKSSENSYVNQRTFVFQFGNNSNEFITEFVVTNTHRQNTAYQVFIEINKPSKYIDAIDLKAKTEKIVRYSDKILCTLSGTLLPQQKSSCKIKWKFIGNPIKNQKFELFMNAQVNALNEAQLQNKYPKISLKILLYVHFPLKIRGISEPQKVFIREGKIKGITGIKNELQIGPKIDLIFQISPTSNKRRVYLQNSKILINFPWEDALLPQSIHGHLALYLTKNPSAKVYQASSKTKIICKKSHLDNLVNKFSIKTKPVIKKSEEYVEKKPLSLTASLEKTIKNFKDVKLNSMLPKSAKEITLKCGDGTLRCEPLLCDFGNMLTYKDQPLQLILTTRLWKHTILEFYSNYSKINFVVSAELIPNFSKVVAKSAQLMGNSSDFYTEITVQAVNLLKQKPPPVSSFPMHYIILLSITGGVLLLSIIAIIMWKCRFFHRGIRKKLIQKRRESRKFQKQSMKAKKERLADQKNLLKLSEQEDTGTTR